MALQSRSSSLSYDVFLSFRGEDTRHGFTGHLYSALHSKGIHTFIDDEGLQRGEEITPALVKAIQESKIAIIVLSINYASSSFCLHELATILECLMGKGRLVLPVFYKVDPSHVRHQNGSYEEALAKHEERFKAEKEKLQKWKMALHQVANLSGYHFKDGEGYEYKFIEKIVEQVSREINPACLHVADYPVGLEWQVRQVRKLLDIGSDDGVHMIGFHGMGGVGKSALARAVYNNLIIDEKFDGFCFLENVREKSNKDGLEHLQRILLSKILGEKDINLASKQQGSSMIQSRLKEKKVVLILDDVDKHEQLQAMVGRPDWFGPGSKIIITTRDKQLLAPHQVITTYEVKGLDEKDALQLLTWKAFKKEKADPNYVEVLQRAVTYASGLPLALEVIGSNLFEKSIKEWESALKKYKRIPKKEILEILKVSFDALEEEEKSVFLDLACCLKGCKLTEAEDILHAFYDDCMKDHIGVLVEKSLVVVKWNGIINMHDLIQDMGRRIDQQESPKEPGKRKRLWLSKDIIQVLEDNSKFRNIKVLKFDKCKFLSQIPDVSHLPSLEELSFERCDNLITVHDSIGFLNKLKILSAKGCSKLRTFPPLNLTSLENLQLSYCYSLENFPEILGEMENIRGLLLNHLLIKEFPVSIQNLIGLQYLHLSCRNFQLQSSIFTMFNLNIFSAKNCKGWQWVNSEEGEENMGSILSLKNGEFDVQYCDLYDDFFSTGFTQFAHVETLCLDGNNFTFLPECIKEFKLLRSLFVSNCKYLQEIRGVPPKLKSLHAINCISLSSSSSSMFLNKELYEAEKISFCFTGATIPKWFNQQSRGPSTSFWFRNEFPDRVLCLIITPLDFWNLMGRATPLVFINGKLQELMIFQPIDTEYTMLELDHTYLFDLSKVCIIDDMFEVALEKEWNHVEVTYVGLIETSLVKATGIHIFMDEERRMDDIQFDDPYRKRKLDHVLNSSESQQLVKNHRLWSWVGPERIKILLRNIADGALSTNAERRYMHNSVNTSCLSCDALEETCLHALRDCPKVAAVWRSVLPLELEVKFFNIDEVTLWLERNLSFSVDWATKFGFAVEVIWESRNEIDLLDPRASSPIYMIMMIIIRYEDFIRAHPSHKLMMRDHIQPCSSDHLFKWRPPVDPWLKLNVDGAIDPCSKTAACGGIFRDYSGRFVLGFSVKLDMEYFCSFDEAEIWGVYHGIKIARQYDFGKIVVESDSAKAIRFVQDGCPTYQQHSFPLCHELRALTLSATNYLDWSLIYREGNMAAASFANFGLSMNQRAWIFSACPTFCAPFVDV
ncbi:TMV resistance protein N isoform X2 [Glycine max]|uniref:TMV resistance protein N isoform X2 n=1 Tax=Glycine max TaxID=3847 RepID=UPI0007192F8C|nr:TMV resistance protein N isoform X2 [Glycine max]|eukprot:XP_014617687.1 TMV resistance protein N isoform X2 [Glycine max]